MSQTKAIAKAIEKALSLWETFIKTRESAYRRKMDKKQVKAIEYGERIALRVKELGIEDKKLVNYVKLFFKYN